MTPGLDQLLETATERHRAGNLAEARALYGQVLAADPAHTVALFRSGLLELQDRDPGTALSLIEKAAAAAPLEVRYQLGLAQVLEALGRSREAAEVYRHLTHLDPAHADAHFALGHLLQRTGQLNAAVAAYRSALLARPADAASMGNLGAVLRELGAHREALELLRQARELEPEAAAHAINLGLTLCQVGDFPAAQKILMETAAREPNDAEAAFNLGNAFRGLRDPRRAIEQFKRAVDLRKDYAEAWNNLANAYKELGEFALARAAYAAALDAQPRYVVALNNAACLERTLGRMESAEEMLRRALSLEPDHAVLHDNLGNVLKDAGELDAAIACYRKALELDPTRAPTHSNLAYALSFQCHTPEPVLAECLRWNARFAAPLAATVSDARRDLSIDRRLKIGYVSPDFRDHCQSLFTVPLLSRHDHAAYEIFCYSSVERPDELTRRIQNYADAWRDVRSLDDAALADLIRGDEIDILVDLTMHMAGGRPLLFARNPAPVSIAWLAYPGTTGIERMHYRISDPRLDPEDFDRHYSETTLRLPDSFWCYDPLTSDPPVSALPALQRGHLTFGCLNNPCKLSDTTLDLWARTMSRVASARLVLMAPPGRHRARLLQRLEARQIAAHRITFVAFRPRGEYLRTYHEIDIGLDTLPYNGHTTSLDAFWMGVPTVTRLGRTCVGRAGLSQLHQLGLAELAAESDDAFIGRIVALAADLPRLAALRARLRPRMESSPLMDAARFARHLEAAYRQAWSNYAREPTHKITHT